MSDPRRKAIVRLRIAIWACAILLFAIQFVHHEIGLFLPAMALALVLLAAAIQHVETRLRRPAKSYARVGIASAAAALLFIALPAYWHGIMWIGALLWVGFTAAGLAWCIQYERTEPLDRP